MGLPLLPHEESAHQAVSGIAVTAERRGDILSLTYRVSGDVAAITLPEKTTPARMNDLWKHTCFEAFIRASDADGYLEFNFSPSSQWAAYRFDGYRAGMRNEDLAAPRIVLAQDARALSLSVSLDLSRQPEARRDWDMNISAIIEDRAGARAYWALAHAPGKPDFHSADCFIARVPPA